MEKSGFFNSNEGDRMYAEEFFAEFFGSFIGNGVYPNPSTGCQVIATGDMTVAVSEGQAWINGRYYHNTDNRIFDLDIADGVLKRIDRIVLRHTTLDREIKAYVKKGSFASTPVAPTLQRDSDAYELGIADIFIENGVVNVSQVNITDLRLNSDYCGIVHGVIDQVDTTTIFNQFQAWYAKTIDDATTDIATMLSAFQNSFNIWFANIQDILDENAAGNLLNKINELIERMTAAETAISNLQKFQTAVGSGTAISLTGIELVDGFQTTFVILVSNSGAATTINGKPLYKPGTTTSPKLIAGKAATVWYNLAGDCFFIKASAEGTATAEDVLAPHTFSNDDDIGLIGTLALTGDAVADDVFLGKTFYKNDPKSKLTGTNPYKSGKMIWYNEFEKPLELSIDALFGNVLASWLFYNKFTNTIMHLWQNGSNYYIRHVNENKEVLFSFSIGSITYGITCVNYGDYAFVFDVNGWKKYSSTGTLLSSGSDFKIDSAFNTSYQRILILESAGVLIGVQPDKSVKWFDLSTSAVIKTLTFSDLVSGYPFSDKYGNWYYEITGGYYKKVNSDGNIVFSQSLGTRLNQNNGNYPVCLLDDLDMFFQTYMTSPPNYFYAKALSMVDGSIIYNTATYNANITYSAQFAKVSNNGKLVILSQLQSQNSVVCMEITEAGVVDYNTFKNISSLGGGGYAPVTAHSIPSYTFADDKLFFCGYLSAASVYLICVVNLGYYLD